MSILRHAMKTQGAHRVGSVRLTERDVVRLERARVRRVGVGQDCAHMAEAYRSVQCNMGQKGKKALEG